MSIFEINVFWFTLAPSYYGLMYALGFMAGYLIIKKRGQITIHKHTTSTLEGKKTKKEDTHMLDDLLLYIFLGVILGGRLGYVLLYNFSSYLHDPLSILSLWEGGMSFHGGVIGVILAMWYFSYKYQFSFLKLTDEVTAILPIGLWLGRIGNYLNNELYGYAGYTGPFSMSVSSVWHFPSPLLEFLLEGVVLFIILNWVYIARSPKNKSLPLHSVTSTPFEKGRKIRFDGQVAALFLILYGVFRIFVEVFFRQPDAHIGYILGIFTMGEILSLPMIVIGGYYYYTLNKKNEYRTQTST